MISARNTVNISLCLGVSWKGNFSLGCCCAAGAGQRQPGQGAPSSGPVLINLGIAGHQQNEKVQRNGLGRGVTKCNLLFGSSFSQLCVMLAVCVEHPGCAFIAHTHYLCRYRYIIYGLSICDYTLIQTLESRFNNPPNVVKYINCISQLRR